GGDKLLGMSNLDKVIALLVARKMDMLQPSGVSALNRHVVQGRDLENAWGEFEVAPSWKSSLLTASESLKRRVFPIWPAFTSDVVQTPDDEYIKITKEELQPFVDAMLNALAVDIRTYLNEAKSKNGISESQIHYVF